MLPFYRERNGEGPTTVYLFHLLFFPAIEHPCGTYLDFPGSPGFNMAFFQQARDIVERTVHSCHHFCFPSSSSFSLSKPQTPFSPMGTSRHREPPRVCPFGWVSFHPITRIFIGYHHPPDRYPQHDLLCLEQVHLDRKLPRKGSRSNPDLHSSTQGSFQNLPGRCVRSRTEYPAYPANRGKHPLIR